MGLFFHYFSSHLETAGPWVGGWVCSGCLWSLPALVLTPGGFLACEVSTGPSTLPLQKLLPRFGCARCDQTCAHTVHSDIFPSRRPLGETWSLGYFMHIHAQSLACWPDPCICATPSWCLISSFSLSQHPQLVSGSAVGASQAAGPRRPSTILDCPCSSSGLLDLPPHFLQLCPPTWGWGRGRKGCQQCI